MNARTWTLMLVLTVAALAGCKKKQEPGPSCRQIVSYMMRFRELGTFDERAAIEDCRKQRWTAAQRRCMYSAKDLGEIGKCVPAIKIDKTGARQLPMPEWHPKVDQPIETGPQRQQREAEEQEQEKARRDAAAGGAGAAPAPGAPAPTPAAPPRPM
jgi:hypothetical protein